MSMYMSFAAKKHTFFVHSGHFGTALKLQTLFTMLYYTMHFPRNTVPVSYSVIPFLYFLLRSVYSVAEL